MLLSTSISAMLRHYECEEIIEMLSEAGFDAIDFSFFQERFFDERTDSEESKAYFFRLRELAETKGMRFNQAHAPMPSGKEDEEWTERRFWDIVRAMRNASYLGIETIVVHSISYLRYVEPGNREKAFEMNMDFFGRLIPYCEQYRIKVAIENQYQTECGVKSQNVTSRAEELIRYVDTLNSKWIVACLDIGHACLVREDPSTFIRKLGSDRLQALHIHDVDGVEDLHTLPFYGISNWERIMQAIKEIGYTGDFTLETPGFLKDLPKELIPAAVNYMAAVGRYLIGEMK